MVEIARYNTWFKKNPQIKFSNVVSSFYLCCILLAWWPYEQAIAQDGQSDDFAQSAVKVAINARSAQIFDSLVAFRRDLHQHPELGGNEMRTASKIAEYLLGLGLEVKTGIGGYGVVGILHGAKKGRKLAWRADIDALASDHPDVVDFESTVPGVRHICGHDVHATIALGIADVLASQKEQLQGTVYFIFQPSEENVRGAKAMIADGLFEDISPEEIYALHVSPYPEGIVVSKAGRIFADFDEIEMVFTKGKDSLEIIDFVKETLNGLETIENPEIFYDPMNFADPEIGLVSPNTIYKDYVSVHSGYYIRDRDGELAISANIGSTDDALLKKAKKRLEKEIKHSKYSNSFLGITYSDVTYHPENDSGLTETAARSITENFGGDTYFEQYGIVSGAGDDFALFQEKVPGVYFLLGASDYEKDIIAETHSPHFQVDENCIKTGTKIFSTLLLERLVPN
ncbi:hypothetical protein LCGC14_1089670 [marine sediment metagenome]|uniref:Amidohydrolase n=2 Tax=root TaxID=1 RepID=A0A831QS31_9FLAO|nr:amidohydrolase [Pricia sp.]HEA22285.1 amidohydrolase [Pricia antarctica]